MMLIKQKHEIESSDMYNRLILSFFLAFSFILFACDKTDQTLISQQKTAIADNSENSFDIKDIENHEGILIFQNRVHFDKMIKYLFNNQREFVNLNEFHPGFVSAQSAFKNFVRHLEEKNLLEEMDTFKRNSFAIILEVDGEKYLEEVVHCPLLAEVINDKGLVIIGNSIFKFDYYNTIEYEIIDSNLRINTSIPLKDNNNLKLKEITPNYIRVENKSSQFGTTSCYKNFNNSRRRVKGELVSTNSVLGGIKLGFQVTSYKRPCGGSLCVWFRKSVYELSIVINDAHFQTRERDPYVTQEWTYSDIFHTSDMIWKNNDSRLRYLVWESPYLPDYDIDVWFHDYDVNVWLKVNNSGSTAQECWIER